MRNPSATAAEELTGAGALIALVDTDDPHALNALKRLDEIGGGTARLLTTWPCMTEALHRLNKTGGRHAELDLWRFIELGVLRLHTPTDDEAARCGELLRQYDFADFADTSLVSSAEVTGVRSVFSFDPDFYAYRLADGGTLLPLPGQDKLGDATGRKQRK